MLMPWSVFYRVYNGDQSRLPCKHPDSANFRVSFRDQVHIILLLICSTLACEQTGHYGHASNLPESFV